MAKKTYVKDFHVEQELKNNGIEIGVWEDEKHMGDVYVAKTGVIWCEGKTRRENGIRISFDELSLLSAYKDEAIKAAKTAKKESK